MSLWDKIKDNPPPYALDIAKEMRESPSSSRYYPQAISRGLVNPDGTVTGRGIDLIMGRDKQSLIHEGLVPDEDNIVKSFVDGFRRQGSEVIAGWAKTAGMDSAADVIRHRVSLDGELAAPLFSESPVARFFDLVGTGAAEIATPVAATAITGHPLMGISATFGRLWGDNQQMLKDTAPNLSELEITAINLALTGFQAAIEHGFGLESRIASLFNRNVNPYRGLAAFVKTKEGASWVRRAAGEFFNPTNPLSGAFAGAVKETFEETAQAAAELATKDMLGAPTPSGEELMQRLIIEPMQAIPAGMVFGAFTYSRNRAKEMTSPAIPTPQEVVTMHTDPKTGEVDEQSLKHEDFVFSELERDIAAVPKVRSPRSVVDTIRALSWAFAKAAHARGEATMPVDFVEGLKTAFIGDNLDAATINEFSRLINDTEIDPLERTNKIMDLLARRAGEGSAVYQMIRDIHQEVEASLIDDISESLMPYIRSLVPTLRDEKAVKAVHNRISPIIKKLVGPKSSAVFKSLMRGKEVAISIETLEDSELGADLYARLIVEPQTLKVDGRNIQVSAQNGFITLQLSSVVERFGEEELKERAKAEAEIRSTREKQGKVQPLNEVIQSDERLGVSRARAFDTFAKYTRLGEEMETYRARVGTKLGTEARHITIPKALRHFSAADTINEMVSLIEKLPEPVRTSYESKAAQLEARRKASIATGAQSRYAVDVDDQGWETVPEDDGFPQQFSENEYQKEERRKLHTDIKPDTGGRHVAGRKITKPSRTYEEGKGKKRGNVWVRQTPRKSNKGRILLVQFSNTIINPPTGSIDEQYYDNLYAQRKGYVRQEDFWEAPLWAATAAYSLDNADFYVIRDMEEAKRFFKEAGYDQLWFSAVEVNKDMINELAEAVPEQNLTVGGYIDEAQFPASNITYQESIEDAVKAAGKTFARGTDYRHILGTPVVPRLVMSNGCLHNCAFCTVPRNITSIPLELIDQQVESFKALKTNLVYINDKTFGQSPNYKYLPEVYKKLKASNPDFEGFIVQTTSSAFLKLDNHFLKEAGIAYVELGVETVNDPILKQNRKPSSVKLLNQAAKKIRSAGLTLIPNIIIGLPQETAQSYANTMDWLEQNKDIISHLNIYNLAVYQNTQLAEDLKDQGLVESDFDENQREKSFHKDNEIHEDFAQELFAFANEMLGKVPDGQKVQPERVPLKSLVGQDSEMQPIGLANAVVMEAMGNSSSAILTETGWHRAKDGNWKYEIDDSLMHFNETGLKILRKKAEMVRANKEKSVGEQTDEETAAFNSQLGGIPLGEIIDHPLLFAHYPHLEEIPVFAKNTKLGQSAAYNPVFNEMYISTQLLLPPETKLERELAAQYGADLTRGILIHEIQHAIQAHEGWGTGANPSSQKQQALALKEMTEVNVAPRMIAESILRDVPEEELRALLEQGPTDKVLKKLRFMVEATVQTYGPKYEMYFEAAKDFLKKPSTILNVVMHLTTDLVSKQPDGSTPFQFQKPAVLKKQIQKLLTYPTNPTDLYRHSAGENEAYMVEARVNLTPLERKMAPYPLSFPVPEGNTWSMTAQENVDLEAISFEVGEDGVPVPMVEFAPVGKPRYSRPLFSQEGMELRGLYLPHINTQLFFQNADEATVIHEFLHHVRTMLPEDVQQAILDEFDVDERGIWTTHVEEKFVDAILTYIRNGHMTDNAPARFKEGIQTVIPVLKAMVSLNDMKLSDDIKAELDKLFDGVEVLDIHQINAEAATNNLNQEGPTAEQTIEIISQADVLASFEPPREPSGGRNAKYARLFAILSKVTKNTNALAHQIAADVFTWFSDGSSLTQLSDKELDRLTMEVIKRYDENAKLEVNYQQSLQDILDYEETKKDVHQDRRIKYTTRAKEKAFSFINSWRKLIDRHDVNFTSPKFLAVILDDYANDGAWHRHYADPIEELQHEQAKVLHDLAEQLHNTAHTMGLDLDKIEQRRVNLAGYTATIGRAVLLALANRQVDGQISNAKKAIMESNGVTEQEFEDAVRIVESDQEAKKFMNYIKFSYKLLYDSLAPIYEKVTGEKLKKVPNYFAILRVDGMFSEDDVLARSLEYVNQYGHSKAASRYTMTKGRTAIRAGQIDLDGALSGLRHYTTQAANYIAKAETVKELGAMINSEEIQVALQQSYGRERGATLHDLLRDLLSREMFPNARTEVMSDHDRFFAFSRQAFTMAMLGFRPTVWIAQLLSKPTFYALFKGGMLPSTMMQDFSNTTTLGRIMNTNFWENKKRQVTGAYKTEGFLHYMEGSRLLWTDENGQMQGLWPKYARHILESHGNPVTGDIIQHGFKGFLGLTWRGVSVGEMALEGITLMDGVTVGSTWLTAFDIVVKKEMDKHGDKDRAEREAARVANDFIAKTQPPRTQFERPKALTGREGFKLLFPFSGQTMQNWQIWMNEVARPSIRAVSHGNFSAFFRGKTEYESGIAQRLMMAFLIPAIGMGFRARRRRPTEEELIKDIMFYPIANIPAIGGTIQYMFVHDADWASIEMMHTRVLNNSIRAVYDIAKAVTGEKKFDKRSLRNFEEALAIPFSIPTASVRFTEETVKLIIDPEYEFSVDYVLEAISAPVKPLPEE
jgi:tRNA A37 methylthiotransferase MiaB